MKVKVVNRFKDKYNPRKGYIEGQVIEVSKERYDEITKAGHYVEPYVEQKVQQPKGNVVDKAE